MTVFEIILTCVTVVMFVIIFAHISCVKEGLEYKEELKHDKLKSDINWISYRCNPNYLRRGCKFIYNQKEYEVILKEYNDVICKEISTDKISTFGIYVLESDHNYRCILFYTY